MSNRERSIRYLIFFLGLLATAVGVALVTKGALGTSPIAAIPYSLSLIWPALSLGTWTFLFSLLLILLQWVLLKKQTVWAELLLQAVISLVFGSFIDLAMACLFWLSPGSYLAKLLSLVVGCVILAFGAYLEIVANVVMLPGDAFVRAIVRVTGKDFGTVRVRSDVSMSVVAAVLCLVFLHALAGVREGTLLAALLTGNVVKFFSRRLTALTSRLIHLACRNTPSL